MKKVKILDVQFDVCNKDEALSRILNLLETRSHEAAKQIVTPNPEMLLESQKNPLFRETLNRAWMSIPDGAGILWAATFQGSSRGNGRFMRLFKAFWTLLGLILRPSSCRKIFSERITGVDLMQAICAVSSHSATPLFLLGAAPGIAEKTKEVLEAKYPGIKIVGTFSASPRDDDFMAIQAHIAETRPEILFVAYGAPAQELWIAQHLKKLPSVKLAMGTGGAFDFIAGTKKRAPKWMQKAGLEWLFRLIQEPSRLKRIWNATVRFPLRMIRL
ncbi:MAG: WecB/TagA/CpsF family glycosyltransferase [Patescibacteria group bacterium]